MARSSKTDPTRRSITARPFVGPVMRERILSSVLGVVSAVEGRSKRAFPSAAAPNVCPERSRRNADDFATLDLERNVLERPNAIGNWKPVLSEVEGLEVGSLS